MRDHLLSRGLDPFLYRVWLPDTCATFPLWGFDGRLRGFQQYRPSAPKKSERPSEGRYFTWSSTPSVWGLDTLPSHGVVFVCESIFKAVATQWMDIARREANTIIQLTERIQFIHARTGERAATKNNRDSQIIIFGRRPNPDGARIIQCSIADIAKYL